MTTEWLGQILGANLSGFESEALGEGAGLLGLLIRVTPQYTSDSAGGPSSLIAKFPTPTAENRVVAETFDMYGRELRFYARLANQTAARTPDVYCAEYDGESSDFALLIEDLSVYRAGDQREGANLKDAERAIDQIVKLHSTWWDQTEIEELAWIPIQDNPVQCAGMTQGFAAGWDVFLDKFGDVLPSGKQRAFSQIGPQTDSCLRRLCSGTRTVVHGDFRLDNLFFGVDDDADQVAMFDWQGISRSCGPQDLGYFLSQSLQSEVRKDHHDALVRRYWDGLCDAGIQGYSFERCWEDYRCAVLYLFTYAVVIAGTLDHSNERGAAMVRQLASRSAETIDEVGALDLLDA
ncbi:MAG: phosphotransferase [Myxococcota bacterium]|nr:phosphotransferase [Myxococcota bacterium]